MAFRPIKDDARAIALLAACTGCGLPYVAVMDLGTSTAAPDTSSGCVAGACGESSTSGETTAVDSSSSGVGETTTTDATTSDGETSSSSTSEQTTTTGGPMVCSFAPGCHAPKPASKLVGRASDVPVGCDGGPFTPAWSVAIGSSGLADAEAPRAVPLLADFDGDGALDLFANMRKAEAGYVFPGLGDGTFDVAGKGALAGGLFVGGWGGDVGDFDGDGTLDVLVGDHVGGGFAWTGGPGPTFTPANSGLPQKFLYSGAGLADFNGDGILDALLGADQAYIGYALARGDGMGKWVEYAAPASAMASNVGHFNFADYDGDGRVDIFAFGDGTNSALTVYVYHNEEFGKFTEVATIAVGPADDVDFDPVQGSVGDVDCDGQVDIAAGGAVYLQGDGKWTLAATVVAARIGHLADMNGDGQLDVVTQDPASGLAVHLGDGSGTGWTPMAAGLPDAGYAFEGSTMQTAYGIDVGDVNADGTLDIVRIAGFGSESALEVWMR